MGRPHRMGRYGTDRQTTEPQGTAAQLPKRGTLFLRTGMFTRGGGGGGGHQAMVFVGLPLAASIGLSTWHILTLCGSERVLVVSTVPLDGLSCLTTLRLAVQRRAVACAVDQVHPDAHSESMLGLPTPAPTCARWCVHLQDHFPDRGF